MSAREYAELVKKMRDAQKRFFAGDRSAEAVRVSKDWERKVDRATAEVLNPPQAGLFDQADDIEPTGEPSE